jgi:hypothetical protein
MGAAYLGLFTGYNENDHVKDGEIAREYRRNLVERECIWDIGDNVREKTDHSEDQEVGE